MNLILQCNIPSAFLLEKIVVATGASKVVTVNTRLVRLRDARRSPAFEALIPAIEREKLDWAFFEPGKKLSDFGLICFDMDSTLINIECIDELADFAGKKTEVAAITESAMRGEIDYRESLRRRLVLLAGLDARVLARVYNERLVLSPGANDLLQAAQHAGLRTAILSGGFTYFTERLRIELGFDFATSNELEISGGKLTGQVTGAIVDAEAKSRHLVRLTEALGLRSDQVIACGDGANDLLMMSKAGLSVAFHAKPAIRSSAKVMINFGGLDSLLNLFEV
jgi:phosphoserine phosphatase